jgi:DNA-binding transcriptional MerR regulator
MTAQRGGTHPYPIRAVSKLTGVSIDTLRAWERRYGAVTPVRDRRGRLYSEADVARLRLIQRAVSAGHSIGRIAALSDHQLQRLAADRAAPSAPDRGLETSALRAALLSFDTADVGREASRLAALLPPIELVRDALLPLLRDVGDQWNARRDGVALEHAMSSTVQHLFGSLLRFHARRAGAARLLFATPAGDRHEIGILAAAVLAASRGLAVSYIGPDVPARHLVEAVKAANAQVLVLGLTFTSKPADRERELRAILQALPPAVEVWIGGRDADRHAHLVGARGALMPDLDSYVAHLDILDSRAH